MMKSWPYQTCITLLTIVLMLGCAPNEPGPTNNNSDNYQRLAGKTMGTTYHLTFRDSLNRDLKSAIDSLLEAVNYSVSTYIDTSLISRFNQSSSGLEQMDEHFLYNLAIAQDVFQHSKGALDPTVMPLVNYWGFGYTEKRPIAKVDSMRVDSLRQLVGLEKVTRTENGLQKEIPEVQLDFSALAKGYGVDEVGRYLESKGIPDYLVEIGGEVRARGMNPRGTKWTIGINTPSPDAGIDDFKAIVELPNRSLATSGNYRNYYELDGRKFAHTINPKTGYPELSDLLSASVFADDCAIADAYATAFMVMGLDEAMEVAESLDEIEAYFIYGSVDGSMQFRFTKGVAELLKDVAAIEE